MSRLQRAFPRMRAKTDPAETAFGQYAELTLAARSKAAAIAALAPTFRALDAMATHASVERAKASIHTMRELLAELEGEL